MSESGIRAIYLNASLKNRGELDDEYRVKKDRDLHPDSRFNLSIFVENSRRRSFSILLTLFLAVLTSGTLHPGDAASLPPDADIQSIIDDFLLELEISEKVEVTVAPRNKRLVSVQRVSQSGEGFLMSFDERFLAELTKEELRATIAHEIGHVWIFTHHPYLQTEELANKIALKLVPRESLELIYERVAHALPQTSPQEINHLPTPDDRVTP